MAKFTLLITALPLIGCLALGSTYLALSWDKPSKKPIRPTIPAQNRKIARRIPRRLGGNAGLRGE
ncbi:hypothetical protein [Methylovulum miyakonense]|uniref:hypothetical protein n=1 Tax=Methylovulum miyakonense TaxID=645578 RepID=UPI0003A55E72|nr:hypothetical protein [Methylovulum miyakonense]